MKAAVVTRYGPPEVVEIREVETPTPGDDEILIRTRAATVSSGDWRVRSLEVPTGFGLLTRLLFGLRRPRKAVLGSELSGEVVAAGKNVTRFRVGDAVVAYADAAMGCHAEYKVMPQEGVVAPKPPGLSFEEAAALSFGGVTALRFLEWGAVQPGERVLVNGASGAVGTAAVQLARHLGATVTGVCSAAGRDLVLSLGAEAVIDYTQEDVPSHGATYDVIVDAAGTLPFSRSKPLLREGGRLLLVLGSLPAMLEAPWAALTSRKRVVVGTATGRPEDLRFLTTQAEAGAFRPVVDRTYPFEQIVAAHRYVDTGRKKGSVVVTFAPAA